MPHAKQGGSGVRAFAELASKFEGTRLENEHIEHTQVESRDCASLGLEGTGGRRGDPRGDGNVSGPEEEDLFGRYGL